MGVKNMSFTKEDLDALSDAEDENPVVKGISTENYDECTCSVCSISNQLEELGLLEEDE